MRQKYRRCCSKCEALMWQPTLEEIATMDEHVCSACGEIHDFDAQDVAIAILAERRNPFEGVGL